MFSSSPALVAGAELEGLALASWRAWVSATAFGLIGWRTRRLSRAAVVRTVAPGMCFGLATGLFFEAAQRTSVANAAIIAAMQPIPMLVAAGLLFGERITRGDVGWFGVALAGAVLMVTSADSGGTHAWSGDLIAAVSTLFGAGYFITSRRARQTLDAVPLMAGSMLWSGVLLLPLALISGQTLAPPSGGELVRLGAIALVPGSGHLLIAYSQRTVPLVIVGVAQLVMPVGAATLAFVFLDQDVAPGQLVGMAITIAALAAHTLHRAGPAHSP